MIERYLERVVDLTDPESNRIRNMSVADARARVASGSARDVRGIDGSFALVGREGRRARLARSLDRPMRYFLAKQAAGPALVVSDRIDAIHSWLAAEGLGSQFHPSYTRMVPAHHVVEIELVGCPDPEARWTRYFTPGGEPLPPDPAVVGRRYVGAVAEEIAAWLASVAPAEPIGVCFSGGIDRRLARGDPGAAPRRPCASAARWPSSATANPPRSRRRSAGRSSRSTSSACRTRPDATGTRSSRRISSTPAASSARTRRKSRIFCGD